MNKNCYGCEYFYVCNEKYIPYGECPLSLREEPEGTGCVLGVIIGVAFWMILALIAEFV